MFTNDRILTEYRADTSHFRRGAALYDRTLTAQERLTNNRLGAIDARWQRSQKAILGASTALTGVAAALGTAQVRAYAEAWRDVERRLQTVGATGAEAEAGLVGLAIRTRSSLGGTAAAVQRRAKSTGDSLEETSRRVETLQKLLAVGGASSGERASVSLQLGQALQSGVLSGDEYKSIAENAPAEFLDALAKAAGVTRAELKKTAEAQRLSTDIVLIALDELSSTADAKFAALAMSGEEAFNVFEAGLTTYIGNLDDALGATASVNDAMAWLGEYLAGNAGGAQELAEAIKVVGAAALAAAGGKGFAGLAASISASARARMADVAAAQAQHRANVQGITDARIALAAAQERRRAAQNDYQSRVFGALKTATAEKKLETAIRAERKARDVLTAAEGRAVVSANAVTAATARLSLAARAGAASIRALNGVVAFFGGPIGLAVTSLTLLVGWMATTESASAQLAGKISSLEGAFGKVDQVSETLKADYADLASAQDRLKQATEAGGDAAIAAAQKDVQAVNARILANEKLRNELALRARLELADAEAALEERPAMVREYAARELEVQGFGGGLFVRGEVDEAQIDRFIAAERDRAQALVERGERTDDLTMLQRLLVDGTTEAEITVEELRAKLEALAADADLASSGVGGLSGDARQLAVDAAEAAAGVQGLIDKIPELKAAAGVKAALAKADADRAAALKGLEGEEISAADRAARAAEIEELYSRAVSEIDGTAEAARDAKSALDDYTSDAYLGSLDGRARAIETERRQYEALRAELEATGATEADLRAAEEAHRLGLENIARQYDKKESGGSGKKKRGGAEDRADLLAASKEAVTAAERRLKSLGLESAEIARLDALYRSLDEAKRNGVDLDQRLADTGKTVRETIESNAAAVGEPTAK